MKTGRDAEARLLQAIRRVPDTDADAAWKYAADRMWPTMDDVDDICREVIRR